MIDALADLVAEYLPLAVIAFIAAVIVLCLFLPLVVGE